jgi:hypothetical protein
MIIYRSVLLRMRNISDKIVEKIKTHILCSVIFSENCHVSDSLTYLLTPWSRVLLEKLTGSHLVKKFPAFCGTRKFVPATCPYPEPDRSSPCPHTKSNLYLANSLAAAAVSEPDL